MTDYQALARRYRPQKFKDVLGQDAIITTLKNAMKSNRIGHAYLFCGSRGTGKTTLARLMAKALNCQNPLEDCEPCNSCASCKEIISGHSLDVIEIDGASNRGIEDIRRINETVIYSTSAGKYKIYIIDEVHMLTKDAFNALLKTLEEPPSNVKFLFATTEPHKVLPTILSRCQRFNLSRIPQATIVEKLQKIAKDIRVEVEDQALHIIAHRAEGGMRDAESLFDQVLAFHAEEKITEESISEMLGLMLNDIYFEIDEAGKAGDLGKAFAVAEQLFAQGKDFKHFVEGLIDHYRTLLLIKLSGKEVPFLTISEVNKDKYSRSAELYTKEQCLSIIEYLIEVQNKMRFAASDRIALESALLWVLRSHSRIPIELLVRRLAELEKKVSAPSLPTPPLAQQEIQVKKTVQQTVEPPKPKSSPQPQPQSIIEDPTPTARELGKKEPKPEPKIPPKSASIQEPRPGHYDTLMQFAAVELEGTIQKKNR